MATEKKYDPNLIVIVYDEMEEGRVRFNTVIYKNLAAFQKTLPFPKRRYQLVPNRREKRSRPR